ncbi:MAG: hypothetical protein ACYC41_03625 [Bacillota bacterium]
MGELTIFQMNDLPAQILPHWEFFWNGGRGVHRPEIGGVARLAGIVGAERRARPGQILFLDCGDALFGSYYSTIDDASGAFFVHSR